MIRYDNGTIKKTEMTKEGFLRADSIVTRTGVFKYINKDGSVRRELRHPNEVFRSDSLKSIELIPITLNHPTEGLVNNDNAKKLSIGTTGENVRPHGDNVLSTLVITHKDGITAVKNGKQELSLGYELDLVPETGTFNGERYDYRQTNIRYNHLAIVDSARAGSVAKIHLDEDDAVQHNADDSKHDLNDHNSKHQPSQGDKTMEKIIINGIAYDAAPEVKNFLEAESSRADKAESGLNTVKEEKTALQANFDTLTDEKKKLEDVNLDALILKGVEARSKLIESATPHLDEDTLKKVSDMSNTDVMEAVVKAKFPKANLDSEQENYSIYLGARFDAAIEAGVDSDDKTIADQKKDMHKDSNDKDVHSDSEDPREKYISGMTDAWKNK